MNETIQNVIADFIPNETKFCHEKDWSWVNKLIQATIHENTKFIRFIRKLVTKYQWVELISLSNDSTLLSSFKYHIKNIELQETNEKVAIEDFIKMLNYVFRNNYRM